MRRNYPPVGFVERLNIVVYASDMNVSEICRRAKISQSCFYSYLHGDSTPSLTTLTNLSRVLRVSTDYLLFGVVEKCNT